MVFAALSEVGNLVAVGGLLGAAAAAYGAFVKTKPERDIIVVNAQGEIIEDLRDENTRLRVLIGEERAQRERISKDLSNAQGKINEQDRHIKNLERRLVALENGA